MAGPFVNGRMLAAAGEASVNPANGKILDTVTQASREDLEQAIVGAQKAQLELAKWPQYKKHDLLQRIADLMTSQRQQLGELICDDAGKPITQALGEVDRAALTFSLAADETRRFAGEAVSLDIDPRADGMIGSVRRFPIGLVSAIVPFNFPLNLLAHKVAPALAVGCAVVVKPPPQCPLTALRLAEIIHEAGAPVGAVNVLPMAVPLAETMASDERFHMLSFTGSPKVGWHLKNVAGKKKVALELGGNAAAIVHEDCGDLQWVAARLAFGAFAYAGQICIKVQRVMVHQPIFEEFKDALVAASAKLKIGDPRDPATVVGPLIDEAAANRVEAWVNEALRSGARSLLQCKREGNFLTPTLLADVATTQNVYCEEVFGPVATVEPYDTFEGALDRVNDSRFGLQAGVFTHDVRRIYQAYQTLQVGGVMINEFPTFRVDNYPYGGIKDSGFGREGVRYAMEEMSEPKVLIINLNR